MKRHPQRYPYNPWNITAAEFAVIAAHFVAKPIVPCTQQEALKRAYEFYLEQEALKRAYEFYLECCKYLEQRRKEWDKEHEKTK